MKHATDKRNNNDYKICTNMQTGLDFTKKLTSQTNFRGPNAAKIKDYSQTFHQPRNLNSLESTYLIQQLSIASLSIHDDVIIR